MIASSAMSSRIWLLLADEVINIPRCPLFVRFRGVKGTFAGDHRGSTLRLLRRELVHQLRPQVFDHRAHFVRDEVDALVFEKFRVQPFQVR